MLRNVYYICVYVEYGVKPRGACNLTIEISAWTGAWLDTYEHEIWLSYRRKDLYQPIRQCPLEMDASHSMFHARRPGSQSWIDSSAAVAGDSVHPTHIHSYMRTCTLHIRTVCVLECTSTIGQTGMVAEYR